MKLGLSLLAIGVVLVLVGCSNGEPSADNAEAKSQESAVQRNGNGPQLGTADMKPAMSASEADSRVGSALKK
jgi:protein involved in sex pheromone biosynthesis